MGALKGTARTHVIQISCIAERICCTANAIKHFQAYYDFRCWRKRHANIMEGLAWWPHKLLTELFMMGLYKLSDIFFTEYVYRISAVFFLLSTSSWLLPSPCYQQKVETSPLVTKRQLYTFWLSFYREIFLVLISHDSYYVHRWQLCGFNLHMRLHTIAPMQYQYKLLNYYLFTSICLLSFPRSIYALKYTMFSSILTWFRCVATAPFKTPETKRNFVCREDCWWRQIGKCINTQIAVNTPNNCSREFYIYTVTSHAARKWSVSSVCSCSWRLTCCSLFWRKWAPGHS